MTTTIGGSAKSLPSAPYDGFAWWQLDAARAQVNDAYGAFVPGAAAAGSGGAALRAAHAALLDALGHDGPAEAHAAARLVLPEIDRARVLVESLGVAPTPAQLEPLIATFDRTMDVLEQALAGAGW